MQLDAATSGKVATRFGMDPAKVDGIKAYYQDVDARRILYLRLTAFQLWSGMCVDPDEELHRVLQKLANRWKD